jgi:hypothetical protein
VDEGGFVAFGLELHVEVGGIAARIHEDDRLANVHDPEQGAHDVELEHGRRAWNLEMLDMRQSQVLHAHCNFEWIRRCDLTEIFAKHKRQHTYAVKTKNVSEKQAAL